MSEMVDGVRATRRIAVLKKRLAHLERRISESPKRLTYDEEEAATLRWVLSKLRELGFLVD